MFEKVTIGVYLGAGIVAPFIIEDIVLALRNLGHTAHILSLGLGDAELKAKISETGIEVILALDAKGANRTVVRELGVPIIAWFVDHPFYFNETSQLDKAQDFVCVWDRGYVSDLQKLGFQQVTYLPLATNPDRFSPQDMVGEDEVKKTSDVVFVGTLGQSPDDIIRSREATYPPEINSFIERLLPVLKRTYNPAHAAEAQAALLAAMDSFDVPLRSLIEHLMDIELSACLRKELVLVATEYDSNLFGGEELASYANEQATFRGKADYQRELKIIYQAHKVVLNATRPQLRTTVNQRLFDVFACGGFLLTDYRSDVQEILGDDWSALVFSSAAELREKIDHFITHVDERVAISARVQARVLKEHTYRVRMEELVVFFLQGRKK